MLSRMLSPGNSPLSQYGLRNRSDCASYRNARSEDALTCTFVFPIFNQAPLILSLSQAEVINEQSLAGAPSMHWPLFLVTTSSSNSVSRAISNHLRPQIQINSTLLSSPHDERSDRQRSTDLYTNQATKYPFLNLQRSRTIVEEVWSRNCGGALYVDPIDVMEEFGWELNLA